MEWSRRNLTNKRENQREFLTTPWSLPHQKKNAASPKSDLLAEIIDPEVVQNSANRRSTASVGARDFLDAQKVKVGSLEIEGFLTWTSKERRDILHSSRFSMIRTLCLRRVSSAKQSRVMSVSCSSILKRKSLTENWVTYLWKHLATSRISYLCLSILT